MKYKHVKLFLFPFSTLARLGLISNQTFIKFLAQYDRMRHGIKT